MKKAEVTEARNRALEMYAKAAIVLTAQEKDNIEIADFGLGKFYDTGLSIVTYINTELCCAKEMVLHAGQKCPDHIHFAVPEIGYPGKEETFRCRYGIVDLYVAENGNPNVLPDPASYTHIVLNPGEQYTLYPGTWHWFTAREGGAVISEFSTKSYDEYDIFRDKNIVRIPEVEE